MELNQIICFAEGFNVQVIMIAIDNIFSNDTYAYLSKSCLHRCLKHSCTPLFYCMFMQVNFLNVNFCADVIEVS